MLEFTAGDKALALLQRGTLCKKQSESAITLKLWNIRFVYVLDGAFCYAKSEEKRGGAKRVPLQQIASVRFIFVVFPHFTSNVEISFLPEGVPCIKP